VLDAVLDPEPAQEAGEQRRVIQPAVPPPTITIEPIMPTPFTC
jgi:hypothetical protein